MIRFPGLFFDANPEGGGGDGGAAAKAEAAAKAQTEATSLVQKTANDALANTSAMRETLEAMSKKVDGLNSQVGRAKRNAEGELKDGEEGKVANVLAEIREGMKDVSKRLDGHEEKFGQADLATMRKDVQIKFQIADEDMIYLTGTSASTLTESATALVARFKVSPAPKAGRPNALLPSHGAPADGADPSAVTPPPPLVAGKAQERAAAMLKDFGVNPGKMHN